MARIGVHERFSPFVQATISKGDEQMGKLSVSIVLAAIGICLAAPGEAHAGHWKIRIDNWGNPDKPADWATNNTIYVEVQAQQDFIGTTVVTKTVLHPDAISGAHDVWFDDNTTPWDAVDYIKIYTNGNDLFVIDHIEVYTVWDALYYSGGTDNMKGYCLSTDPTDYQSNDHCIGHAGGYSKTWYL